MLALLLLLSLPGREIIVRPAGPVTSLAAALVLAHPGDTITVQSGRYPTNGVTIRTPRLLVRGQGWPILDGEGKHEVLVIAADGVTVTGFVLRGAGVSMTQDQAALRVREVRDCRVIGNKIEAAFFGIYLQRSAGCRIHGNDIRGTGGSEARNGNGIHLWNTRDAVIDSNVISGHRDGIYLEFARHVIVTRNRSHDNRRYGLHFMFSDSCTYRGNDFRDNGAGVAVMYARGVTVAGNRFVASHGSAAYGLLLKEIRDSRLTDNTFLGNTVGLYTEGASRNLVIGNIFHDNGWAIRLLASSEDNIFQANEFVGNSFDVTTNGRSNSNRFRANRWDRYTGYDLDHDGVGDVPYRPVHRFALLVEQHESAILLLRSPFADLLDLAESVLPILAPETLVDPRPVAPGAW